MASQQSLRNKLNLLQLQREKALKAGRKELLSPLDHEIEKVASELNALGPNPTMTVARETLRELYETYSKEPPVWTGTGGGGGLGTWASGGGGGGFTTMGFGSLGVTVADEAENKPQKGQMEQLVSEIL